MDYFFLMSMDYISVFYSVTCRFGSFAELFTLPDDVDVHGIRGAYEGGLLSVRLPRAAPPSPIPVASSSPRDAHEGQAAKLLHTPFVAASPKRRAIFKRRADRGRTAPRPAAPPGDAAPSDAAPEAAGESIPGAAASSAQP